MIILFALLTAASLAKQLQPSDIALAIDCGSETSFQSNDRLPYSEDKFFFGQSRVADYTYNEVVQNGLKFTYNPKIYFTERHGESFGYRLPLQDGDYTIILQFVELYFDSPADRRFDVYIGRRRVLHNFSILDEVHQQGAVKDEYIHIRIKEDKVYYKDQVCENGYENDKVVLKFDQGAADLPKIDGIVVVRGFEADEEEKRYLIENWDKIIQEQEKSRQQKANREEEQFMKNEGIPEAKIEPIQLEEEPSEDIFTFMLSPYGLCIICVLVMFVFCMIATERQSATARRPPQGSNHKQSNSQSSKPSATQKPKSTDGAEKLQPAKPESKKRK